MSEELGELEYTEDEELRCGAHYGGEDKPTELMLIRTAEQENEELKYYIFGEEELCIARRIRQMIESGEQVWKGDEARACKGKPTVIIAKTHKGRGVSFMEDQAGWHGKAPNEEEAKQAVAELGGEW